MIKKLDRYIINRYENLNSGYRENDDGTRDTRPLIIEKVGDLDKHLDFFPSLYSPMFFLFLASGPSFAAGSIFLICKLFIKLNFIESIFIEQKAFPVLIFLLIILTFVFLFINFTIIQTTGRFIIKKTHHLLPQKDLRENEILTFYNVQKELFDATIKLSVMEQSKQAIEDWKSLSPKEFCLKYFNIDTPNFVQYVKERGSYNGKIQDSFIAFITNIPKSNEMSIDSLRKIMIHPIVEEQLVHKEHLELVFANYTPVQIEKIFTNYLGKDQFEELLTVAQPAAIYPNFLELLENETKQVKTLTSALEEIHNRYINNFKIKVLRTKKDYTNASLEFANCVRGYFSHSGNVITFFKDSEPVACVYIEYNEISQIKGYRNAECSKKSEIIKILKENNIITG